MKKTILASLRALNAGVMTLCVASLTFVSCYDDTEMKNQMGALDQRLQTVENLTAQLESLSSQIEGLYTLHFKVDSDFQLLYTFDGVNYVATGITVPQNAGKPTIEIDGDLIKITVGEQSFMLEKPEVVKFEILAGRTFFDEQETKEIPLRLAGIKSIFFAKIPQAWSAVAEDGTLKITAPEGICPGPYSDEHYEENHVCLDANGTIEVWAATEDGKIMVGTINVSVSQPFSISVSSDYVATITISEDPDYANPYQVYYGVCEKSQYDPEALLAQIKSPDTCTLPNNHEDNYASTVTINVPEVLGKTPEAGEEYIVWAVTPIIEYSWMSQTDLTTVNDFAKYYICPSDVEFSYEAKWNDAELNVKLIGADKMFAGFLDASGKEYFDIQNSLNPGPWGGGVGAYYGTEYCGSCGSFGSTGYTYTLNPASTYYVFVLPIDPMRSLNSYTNDDVKFFPVTTCLPEAGGTASVVVDADNSNISYGNFTLSAQCESENCLYQVVLTSELGGKSAEDKAQLVFDGLAEGKTNWLISSVYGSDLTAGTAYTVLFMPIDESGKYSLVEYSVSTLAIPVSTEVAVEFAESNASTAVAGTITFKLNITGDVTKIKKVCLCYSSSYDETKCQINALTSPYDYWLKRYDYNSNGDYAIRITTADKYDVKALIVTTDDKVTAVDSFEVTVTAQ